MSEKLKSKLYKIIFEAETPSGKLFDIVLVWLIILSVLVVLLESIRSLNDVFHHEFLIIEWIVTILFTIEYFLRIYCVKKPLVYMRSFFGIIDILSILPAYLELIFVGSHFLITIRVLRLLRIFKLFKLARYNIASSMISSALKASKEKIYVFLIFIVLSIIVAGSLMYVIEGPINEGFDSIPRAMYWAIVTLTTVGYGDITPVTAVGQFISACIMILGYSVIAVPTGIVTSEMTSQSKKVNSLVKGCRICGLESHDYDAHYCKNCGSHIDV